MLELQPNDALPAALALAAAAARHARLPAARRRSTSGSANLVEMARELADVADRARRLRDRRDSEDARRGRARIRALVLRAHDAAGDRSRRPCSRRPRSARSCCRGRSASSIATDGAWVRNFPLGHAYDQPGVELIVSFRYLPSYPRFSSDGLARLRRRLERFPKLPPVRALIARAARGGGARRARRAGALGRHDRPPDARRRAAEHRCSRSAPRVEKDAGARRTRRAAGGRRGDRTARGRTPRRRASLPRSTERFAAARFPFLADRLVPRIAVSTARRARSASRAGLRNPKPWSDDAKRELIARGYELLDEELRERAVA